MAQLIDITKVEVGPRTLTATVRLSVAAPRMTSDDLEGTTRVYNLMPHIIEHVCLGDAGDTFRDVMGHTELAHLLEHMTVELLAQTNVAGDITSGRTSATGNDGRTFEIELACPDDVLVAGALSSAAWMMGWAFDGGRGAEPDVEATVSGLVALVESLPEPEPVVLPSPVVAREVDDGFGQTSASTLQLVDDVDDGSDVAETGRLSGVGAQARTSGSESVLALVDDGAESTARISVANEVNVELVADAPPRESPEARQSATDVPLTYALSPDDGLATPSVTGNLPLSQSVR